MPRQMVSAICVLIIVLGVKGCTTVRGKLSESDWGDRALKTYDRSVSKVHAGVNYSTKKASQFISDADNTWLKNLLKSSAQPAPPSAPLADTLSTATSPRPSSKPDKFRWPIAATKRIEVTSQYGWHFRRRHRGIDIGGPLGTPIHAVAPGTVILAANHHNGYGNLVIVQHANAITSHYAHNSSLKVKKGQVVQQGATIALLGSTGRSSGPHLHFEIRRGDQSVNPCLYLPPHSRLVCKG